MNFNINKLLVFKEYSIKDTLKVLDLGAKGIVFLVDENKKLIGSITDGDIRRALLKDISIEESVEKIIHYNPIYAEKHMTRSEIKDIFIKKAVKQLPIVDSENRVIGLISINDILLPEGKDNPVMIMAGGLGTRLKELTQEIPKPMLKVGNDPMLQHIIRNFKDYGYNEFLISVNYKADIIENYFQDGYAYGVKIEYIRENKRLGTAGGIKLAQEYINEAFFVINGDIFTNVNVENMMNFHLENKFDITVGVRKHSFQIPYGVIDIDNHEIKMLREKPVIDHMINAGVYCLNPEIIKYIPEDEYFEITDLINICIKNGMKVGSYEINEYWIDIGRIEDYKRINDDISSLICVDEVGGRNDK